VSLCLSELPGAALKSPGRLHRDVILFLVGLAGVIHEVFFTSIERPDLLIVCAAMMGLPLLLRANGH
jgi:hypothetical protein